MKMLFVRTSRDTTRARAKRDFKEMEKFALVTLQKLKPMILFFLFLTINRLSRSLA